MNKIMQILDEDLRQGALVLLLLLLIWLLELVVTNFLKAQKVVGNYGRLTSVHYQISSFNETPTEAPIAFDEMFTNAMLVGAPLLMAITMIMAGGKLKKNYKWLEIKG